MKFDFSVLSLKQQHQMMTTLLESEQRVLWDQFMKNIDNAVNKIWSVGCQDTVDRILENAMLVGPAPWKSITWTAVGSGLWSTLWWAAQLVNTPDTIPTAEIEEVEDKMSQMGMIEKKTITYLHTKYGPTRMKMSQYVIERRQAGAFNVDGEPEPECTCAMTEASFFACAVHGENAKETVEAIWPEKKGMKTLGESLKGWEAIHCTCANPADEDCPVHGPKMVKEPTCTCSPWPSKTSELVCEVHGLVAQAKKKSKDWGPF